MELITPNIGLLFWTTTIFLIVLIILRFVAWRPILNAIKTRENSINAALSAAERARAEIAKLEERNERSLQDAKVERDFMLREAREIKDTIVNEAREKAAAEAAKMFDAARKSIENEKISAIAQIKDQIALLSVEIAEKIIRKKLAEDPDQKEFINKLLDEIKFN